MRNPIYALRAVTSVLRLIKDPNRLGEVFSLSEHMMALAPPDRRKEIVDSVRSSPEARRALADKPRVGTFDLVALAALPAGTLGHAFAHHMKKHGLDPSALPSLPSRTELEFLRAHLYETHDIWHAVTDFDTDVAGELGLQAFYLAQLPGGLPAAILGLSFFNTLVYAMGERDDRMRAIVRGWLLGKRAKPFFGVRWGEMWSVPLVEVRRRLGVDIGEVEAMLPGAVFPRAA